MLQRAHIATYVEICELALNCYPLVHRSILQSQQRRLDEGCASNASFLYKILYIFVVQVLSFTFNKQIPPKRNPCFPTDFGLNKSLQITICSYQQRCPKIKLLFSDYCRSFSKKKKKSM